MYPKSEEVLAYAKLRPIGESIQRRRNTVLRAIEGRPILEECRRAERRRGSPRRSYWWEQEFNLDVAGATEGEESGAAGAAWC